MTKNAPIGHTLTINRAFADQLTPDELQRYVDTLAMTARSGGFADTDQATEALERNLAEAGFETSPSEVRLMAEHFVGDDVARLAILDADGNVLRAHDGAAHQPPLQRSDPDAGDRPFFA